MPRRSRSLLLAAVLLAVSAVALGVTLVIARPRQAAVAGAAPATRTAPLGARAVVTPAAPRAGLLDGMPMTEAEGRARSGEVPVAVMVDNWVDGRPQYGLDRAEVVYEALVEYGITRFMAVYWRNDAPRIEPVRSARTQFLGMALELGAVYAHVGAAAEEGPADADAQMREWGVRSVDEGAPGGPITRDRDRIAPHNAVTSTAALRAYARAQGWTGPAQLTPWTFTSPGGAAGTAARGAEMDFDITGTHGGAFTVRWEYDPASNSYRRFQAGAPHVDAGSRLQLTAANVIIHLADVRPAGDRSGHVLYQSEGTGRALVLRDGHAVEATWRKDARSGRTRYVDSAGRDLALTPGATWVEMLPESRPLNVLR